MDNLYNFFERQKRRFKWHSKWLIIQNSSWIKAEYLLFGSCIQPKTSKRTTAFFFVTFSLSWTVQLFKPCTTLMSIRLERERIWWKINGSINQSNAFLGSNPWPCPNGLHSNPVNHWAWKGGYFWSYGIKIQTHFDFRIQTLGEFLLPLLHC